MEKLKQLHVTDEIQQKILREYEHGYQANRTKNAYFDTQKDIYAVKKNTEQMRSQLFRDTMRTIQATCIINEPDITWEDQDILFQQEARNFSDMYKSDYIKNNWDFDRYM